MKRKLRFGAVAALAAAAALLASCAGTPSTSAGAVTASGGRQTRAVYATSGRAIRMLEAINQCTVEALKLAVVDLIGDEWAQKYQPQLAQAVYTTNNPNQYIFPDETVTTRKDKVGDEYIYEQKVVVNLVALENTLRANKLLPAESSGAVAAAAKEGASGSGAAAAAGAASSSDGASPQKPAGEGPTPEEKRIIRDYVDKMTYLVYFNEQSAQDPFAAKMAVGVANEYLVSNTMEAIDFDQVEKLKKDEAKVYEEQSGQEMSLIQWIAQKLNADVYIEIDARSTGETSGSGSSARHYGQANVTIKAYESSTGRLLGTQNWNSPKTTSLTSQDDAKLNAVQASVYKSMPVVIDQCKAYMGKAAEKGIRYELIVQKTSDTRLMNDFRRKLAARVKDVKTVTQSAEETKYDVWLIGSMDDLVEAVYAVADSTAGLESMDMVLRRSKSATFDTGL